MRAKLILLLSIAFASVSLAYAAGPTNEEESIADYNSGRYPLVISSDGEWRVHVDEHNVLQRVRLNKKGGTEKITPSMIVRAISTSLGARKAAITDGDCVAIVKFSGGSESESASKAPQLKWLGKKCEGNEDMSNGPASRSYQTFSIALSNDGKHVAVAGNPIIQILDAESGIVTSTIPTGAAHVLHVRFIDNDRKLLVVQAVLGEQWESPAEGSDMQFAIWDLQKGELFNFYHTQTAGTLLSDDLFWSYSDKTGELWAINTNGAPWEGPNKLAPIQPYLINLKQCDATRRGQLKLPQTDWVDFTADPLGRWVAAVESRFDTDKVKSRLIVRNASNGDILLQQLINSEIRSLTSSPDGETIYAVTSGQPDKENLKYTRVMWQFTGGGNGMKFSLTKSIKGLKPSPESHWPAQRCLLDDEGSIARDIAIDDRERPVLFEVPFLGDTDEEFVAHREENTSSCSGDVTSFFGHPRSWGGDGEHLWIDRVATLEQISLVDGHVELSILTPRSKSRCSIPVFDQKQFINWEGDTISLRPFNDTYGSKKILVRKKGWTATTLEWFGGRFGVRWIKNGNSLSDKEARLPDGSAVAILYDASGEVLKQTDGYSEGTVAHFPTDDEEEGGEGVFAYSLSSESKEQRVGHEIGYEWSLSYSGSVQARLMDLKGKSKKIVFWDGLDLGKPLRCDNDSSNYIGEVHGLTGEMGILVESSDITMLDAVRRQRITGFSASKVGYAEWFPNDHALVVGTYENGVSLPMLRAYKVETSHGDNPKDQAKDEAEIQYICDCVGEEYQGGR